MPHTQCKLSARRLSESGKSTRSGQEAAEHRYRRGRSARKRLLRMMLI
jgi:hypothetical protein